MPDLSWTAESRWPQTAQQATKKLKMWWCHRDPMHVAYVHTNKRWLIHAVTQHSWLLAGWLAGCLAGGGGGGGTGAATGGTGGAPPTPPPPHRHTPTPTPHYTTLHHATHSARGLYACLVKRIGSSRGREKKRERESGWVGGARIRCMHGAGGSWSRHGESSYRNNSAPRPHLTPSTPGSYTFFFSFFFNGLVSGATFFPSRYIDRYIHAG